jgi:hypothetical protein
LNPNVKFVGADNRGLISTESWQATRIYCPRCGKGEATVWVLLSEPPVRINDLELRVFLCISCNFTALGLNGFKPNFNPQERSRQIIKYGFGAE